MARKNLLEADGPLGIAVLGLILLTIPLYAGHFYTRLVAVGVLYGLAAVGFNILFGYTGLLSFGHAMFWGIGAYGVAIGLIKLGLSFTGSFLLAFVLVIGVSLLTGFFSLRHTKIYFAMLTLAFAQLIYAVLLKWRDVSGGDEGLYGLPRPLNSVEAFYYVIIIVVILTLIATWRFLRTPIGLAFQTIRDNPYRAEVIGFPVSRIRLLSYVVSGVITGVAGMLYSLLQGAVTPDTLYWTFSAAIVFMAILGGTRVFLGPFIGGILYVFIANYAMDVTEYWLFMMGVILATIVYLFPSGVIGALMKWLKGEE